MRLACQAFDGTVEIICLKGGLVTDVEQEEMDTIISDGKADAKISGVECQIERKDMSFRTFVQEYGEPYGVTVDSVLAHASPEASPPDQQHGTPEPETAVDRTDPQRTTATDRVPSSPWCCAARRSHSH
eukprot:COSAG02_NODE_1481_length_12389_cov_15.643857_18_plen_129_part_00